MILKSVIFPLSVFDQLEAYQPLQAKTDRTKLKEIIKHSRLLSQLIE